MKKVYIGIDAHKDSNTIALAFAAGGEPQLYGTVSSDLDRFVRALRRIQATHNLKDEEVAICYEAGPTGFVLARRLQRLGYRVEVMAPSLIPVRAGDRIKTDRRDARKLAGLFRAGELTAVHIPDADDEAIRDVCRGRTDAVEVRTRARQQLGGLLLRNGHLYTGKSRWTEAHMRYLRELSLPSPAQRIVLEEYLQRIDTAADQVARYEQQMDLLLQTWNRRPFVEALQGFRGFQLVASMTLTAELGDLTRFPHPRALMAYLGLVPGENTTGERRRQGPITKCGNSHARWMLVEIAHAYSLPPKVSMELSKRQQGLSREVRAISWRAQHRLHRRFLRLTLRGLHWNKVIIAVARELTAFIWELAQLMAGHPRTPRNTRTPEEPAVGPKKDSPLATVPT
jgi:transposase